MVFKIADLIPDRFKRKAQEEPEPALHAEHPLDEKLGKKIQKRQAREGRAIDTRQGGPNMPKYQPCPFGHGWKRRKEKTMRGALYYCKQCQGSFFVKAK